MIRPLPERSAEIVPYGAQWILRRSHDNKTLKIHWNKKTLKQWAAQECYHL